MKKYLALACASAAALTVASEAHAGAFYIQEQGVRGTGRAYSGEAADTGVESLWWNPASIARSGREVYVGANAIMVDAQVQNAGSTITYPGGVTVPISGEPRAFNPINKGVVPNFAIAMPIGDRFAIGLSAAAPYNVTTEYRTSAFTRYDAIMSRLTTVDIQLTGAMKVTDWLDLGVGADAENTNAKLSQASPNLSPLLPDGVSQLSGDGWNYGWTVGAQAHFDRVSLGASYRSAMDHDIDGHVFVGGLLGPLAAANGSFAGSGHFTTPWIATIGARWRVTDALTLNAQAQRLGWSEFSAINISSVATGNEAIPQNYKDTTTGAVGVDWDVAPRLTLRAGVGYDPTPTPDVGRTARIPDSDRWIYSVGATGKISDRMKLDLAFAYIDFKNARINRTDVFYPATLAMTTTSTQGTVGGEGYVLSAGLRTSF